MSSPWERDSRPPAEPARWCLGGRRGPAGGTGRIFPQEHDKRTRETSIAGTSSNGEGALLAPPAKDAHPPGDNLSFAKTAAAALGREVRHCQSPTAQETGRRRGH